MAIAVGLPAFTQAEAQSFYDLRSHLAHGQETGQLSAVNYALYRLGKDVLRKVIARAILEPSFAATFADGYRDRGELGKVVKREIQMTRAVCGGNVHTPEFRLGGFARKDGYCGQARRTVRCMRNLQTP